MFKIQYIVDAFWDPVIWLPPNITWLDITTNEEARTTDFRDLNYPLIFSAILMCLRHGLEKYWFTPVGLSLGIKNARSKKPVPNPVFERAYLGCAKLKHKQIMVLAKQVGLNERQVERWLRLRRMQDKPSTISKFCETSWRWLYYTGAFCSGLLILWEKPWFWDLNLCFHRYPFHDIASDVWWYYMVTLSFYWSLIFTQFFDAKRKDFWQMLLHHIVTIFLLSFSWICNLHRLGSLIILLHDTADAFLEAAKVTKFTRYQRFCDALFIMFAITWLATRCFIFPFWIIYSSTVEAPKILPMFPAYYIFNLALIMLLGLHIFWTHIIFKMVLKAISTGNVHGDIHSSSSENAYNSSYSSSYSPKYSPKKLK